MKTRCATHRDRWPRRVRRCGRAFDTAWEDAPAARRLQFAVQTEVNLVIMALNDYVTIGHSGLRVSPFCLGAMTFGEDWGWGSSVAESEAIMARFMDRGGNFIDTANVYTKGHSEKIIGDFVGRDPAKRDRVVLATKFFGNLYPGDPNGGGAGG